MDAEEGSVNFDEKVSFGEIIDMVILNDRGGRVWTSVGGHLISLFLWTRARAV
jgi:hypothetical protein